MDRTINALSKAVQEPVELLPVVREEPKGSWQVVIIAEKDRFLIRGYGESQEKPLREESVEFPKPTTETR